MNPSGNLTIVFKIYRIFGVFAEVEFAPVCSIFLYPNVAIIRFYAITESRESIFFFIF